MQSIITGGDIFRKHGNPSMSYLLFLDESGHDHRNMPYEVHGGIALDVRIVWPFVQKVRALEEEAFGDLLHRYGSEIKGHKLLDRDRFKWASQEPSMPDPARRKHAKSFLSRGHSKSAPTREEFTAYGQASLLMAQGIFQILDEYRGILFASAVPRKAVKPSITHNPDNLRKDFVFLLERYAYFLEEKEETGLLILDQTDTLDQQTKTLDRKLVRHLERYFTLTQAGRARSQHIVPSPLFVASDMTYPLQVADLCIYCLNWGFRLPARGMNAEVRSEIADEFGTHLRRLQWQGKVTSSQGEVGSYGIVYVPDLYTSRLT